MATLQALSSLRYLPADWQAPIDVDDAIARCPESATMKGLMSAALVELCAGRGQTIPGARARYLPFHEYPLREHMALMRDAGSILWPDDNTRMHFRRMGRGARDVLLDTPYGRVALGKGGMTPPEVLERLARSYEFVLGFRVLMRTDVGSDVTTIYLEMHDVLYYLDSCHVGVVEGAMLDPAVQASGRKPRIDIALQDIHNGVIRVRW